MSLRDNKLFAFVLNNFYFLILVGYLISVIFLDFSIGYYIGLLLLVIAFFLISKKQLKFSLPLIFLLIQLLSGLFYITNGMPLSLYIRGVLYCSLPILFSFVESGDIKKTMIKNVVAIFLSIVIGYILNYLTPSQFGKYLVYHSYSFYNDVSIIKSVFNGLYGVTMVASFSAICGLCFYFFWLYKKKIVYFLLFALSIVFLVIAARRSATAGFIVIFAIGNIFLFIKEKQYRKRIAIVSLLTLFAGLIVFLRYNDTILSFFERNFGFTNAASERSQNWVDNLNNIGSYLLFGKGLGSSGHLAYEMGYLSIHDNSYLFILMETGIVGLFVFALVVLSAFKFFICNRNKTITDYVSLAIILLFLIQAIGSNVFEFPVLSCLFWFSYSILRTSFIDSKRSVASLKYGPIIERRCSRMAVDSCE